MSAVPALTIPIELQRHEAIEAILRHLISYASANGFVVELTLQPLQPLAMGNYKMVSHARRALKQP